MRYLRGQPTERVIFPHGHETQRLITSLPVRNFHRVAVTLSVSNGRKSVYSEREEHKQIYSRNFKHTKVKVKGTP